MLPSVIHRVEERLAEETPKPVADKLWAATFILMGLQYPAEVARQLLQGVMGMKESVTYQAIIEEGRAKGVAQGMSKTLLRQGRKRFGPPSEATVAAIEAITDLNRLEALSERLLDVSSWDELLAGG